MRRSFSIVLMDSMSPIRRSVVRRRRRLTAALYLICVGVSWSSQQDIFFDPAPESQDVNEGADALIRCDVSNRYMVSFYWTFNGKTLANTTRRFQEDSNLRILNVDRNLENGSFRCVAVNVSTGIAVRSIEARLHIFWLADRVEVVEEDADDDVTSGLLQLLCHVDANPEPTFEWFRNREKLTGDDRIELRNQRIRMTVVTPTDNGVYSCQARNQAGQVDSLDGFILARYDESDSIPRLNISTFTQSVVVKKFSSAGLHCQFLSGVSTNWYFNKLHLANTTKYRLLLNGTLIINSVDKDDTGSYLCLGVGPTGQRQSFASQLLLAYLNNLNESSFDPRYPGGAVLPVGSKFDIRCLKPKGLPVPTSRWLTPHGAVLSSGTGRIRESEDGTLSIGRIEETDGGSYVCEMENLAGVRSRSVNLVVSVVPRITKHPMFQSVFEGETASLRCEFLATPYPTTTVSWKKDGQTLDLRNPRFQQIQGLLKVVGVLLSDEGDYACAIVSRGHSAVTSQTARIRVLKRLQFRPLPSDVSLELNSQANITCRADGTTAPAISWQRIGRNLPSHVRDDHAGTLVFGGVVRGDAGLYVCLAANSQGTINATIRVDYFMKPSFTVRPGNVTAPIGRPFMIHCAANGEPTPTIHWNFIDQYFNPVRFRILDNGTLLISKVSVEDSGRYQCIADNGGGREEQEIYLIAQDVPDDTDSSMVKTIVIAVCSVTIYLGVMIALIVFCLVRRMKHRTHQDTTHENASNGENKRLMRTTDKDPLGSKGEGGGLQQHPQSSQTTSHLLQKNAAAFDLPPPLSRQHLEVLGLLGKCQYGDVFLARNHNPGAVHPLVSIKSLSSTYVPHQTEFQRELEVLSRANHKNIARLTGICCNLQPPILVIEYTEWGDLKQFLLSLNTDASRLMQATLTLAQQLEMCRQVAVGMDHLSANRLVHRDLAARNILVTPFLGLKISHLSLCRDIYAGDYFHAEDRIIPVRWMAPESVFHGEFTSASDVWAYGVTVVEILQLGATPLAGRTDEELLLGLKTGARLHVVSPHGCPEPVWKLVQRCTTSPAFDRPSFADITKILDTTV